MFAARMVTVDQLGVVVHISQSSVSELHTSEYGGRSDVGDLLTPLALSDASFKQLA